MKKFDENGERVFKDKSLSTHLKYLVVAVMDIALAFLCNVLICYFTENGHIVGISYSPILFSYIHLILLSVVVMLVNYLLGLYRSVWAYAGLDELVRGIFVCVHLKMIIASGGSASAAVPGRCSPSPCTGRPWQWPCSGCHGSRHRCGRCTVRSQ